ncbi:MAG TPA: ester cyclase [Candidatus Angelobacter sp.]|nr:ester cyclase [Candidatus Angelobacter sp.]
MQKSRILGFIACTAIIGCGLALATAEQTRPKNQLPVPGAQAQPGKPLPSQASAEQNKIVVRRVFDELFNQGRYEGISQIYASNCQVHTRNRTQGLQEAVSEGKGWRSAAPDLVMTPHQMSVQGDIVMVSWTARGTHTGRGNDLAKPTGKPFVIHGSSRFRMANGKIAEVWNDWDRNELYRQIGVSPKVGQLYEAGQDLWAAVTRFFSGHDDDAGESAQPSR